MRKLYWHFYIAVLGMLCLVAFTNETKAQLIVQDSFFSECRRSVEFRVSGGVAPYTYRWFFEGELIQTDSNLAGSQSTLLSQAQAGNYTVIATDNLGRTLTRHYSFLGVSNFSLNVDILRREQCGEITTAVITGNIDGGLAPYTIRFIDLDGNVVRTVNNFPGGPLTVEGIRAGEYVVEVEDANLCLELTNIEIPPVEQISFQSSIGIGTFPETCEGNGGISFNLTGFEGEVRFRIIERRGNNNNNNRPVTDWIVAPGGVINYDQLPAGNYILEVIDLYRNQSCPARLNFTINKEVLLDIKATATNVSCVGGNNGTITVRADRVFMNYPFPPQNFNVTITGPNNSVIVNNVSVPIGANSGQQTWTGFGPGTYTISVSHGGVNYPVCTQVMTVRIDAPNSPLSLNTTANNVTCFGANDGRASVNPSGGWGNYTYLWSNGATTQTVTGLAPGNYSVTVTDREGCTAVANVTITGPPAALTANITGVVDLTCVGSNDGRATVTNVAGGWGNYTYLWSNGETTATAFNLPAGQSTVRVRDSGGCELVLPVSIGVPPSPQVTSTPVSPTCFGASDGSLRIQISDPSNTYSVTLNGVVRVGNDVLFNNLPAGNYVVNIAYEGGKCVINHQATIGSPSEIRFNDNNLNINHVLCHGNANGSITGLRVNGGTGTLTYQWQIRSGNNFVNIPGQTGLNISNLSGGTYRIVVRDANNCEVTRQFTINEPGPLAVSAPIITNVNCYGEATGAISFTISGGTAPYTYRLNGGSPTTATSNTVTISGLAASNNNFIEVRDANNCQVPNINFNITSLPQITVTNTNVTTETCTGQNNGSIQISVSGGSGSLGVQWFRAGNFSTVLSNNTTLSNRGPGEYVARVFDVSNPNCFILHNVTIPPTPELTIQLNGQPTNVLCFGESTGAINVTASGGTGALTYRWTGPNGFTSNAQNISNAPAGQYNVRVTDANGCFKEINNILISQPASGIQINVLNAIEPTCHDATDGRIEIQAGGGNPGYNYSWFRDNGSGVLNAVGSNSPTLANIGSGTYIVRVTDANNCTREQSISLLAPDPIQVRVVNVEDVTCHGRNNGKIFIEVTGGTGLYFYNWDHGFINQNPTNLSPGTYSVTVRDSNGCLARLENIVIEEPDPLEINLINTVTPSCLYNDGSIEVEFTGALPGAGTSRWYNVETGDLIAQNTSLVNGLTPGFYRVEYSSGASCTVTKIIRLDGPPSKLKLVTNSDDASCPADFGVLSFTATGGVPGYTFQIFLGGIWQNITNSIVSNLSVGNYDIRVTDSAGCVDTGSITINQTDPPFYTTEVIQDVSCFNGNDGIISFGLFGNSEGINVQWFRRISSGNGIPIPSSDLNNLVAGTYYFELEYASGCIITSEEFIINQPPQIVTVPLAVQPLCGDERGSFSLTVNGGKPGKTIQINSINGFSRTFANENTGVFNFDNLPHGEYTWTVEDPGCGITSGTFTINQIIKPTFTVESQNISCFGGNNGVINITNTTLHPGRSFTVFINNVSQGSNTSFTNLAPGNYQVRIIDNFGCLSDPVLVQITGPDRPLEIINFTKENGECFGTPTGRISFGINGGVPLYRALLTNTEGFSTELNNLDRNNTYEFTNLVAGQYTLLIFDQENICQVSRSFTITQPDLVAVTHISPPIACEPNLTFIRLNITGGKQPHSITWERFNYSTSIWELIPFNGLVLENVGAGLYRYTVEDANACSSITEDVLITPPPAFELTFAKGEILCHGGNTIVQLTATFGTADNFTYFVNGNQIFGNQFIAIAGTYTAYAINNASGCRSEDVVIQIDQPASPLTLQGFNSQNLTCYDSNNGRIAFTLVGGTAPYTITFQGQTYSGNDGEEIVFENLAANINYSFTAVDANGCPVLIPSRTLTQPTPIQVNVTNTTINCAGNLARINLQVTGGQAPYQIDWAYSTDGVNFTPNPSFENATQLNNLIGGYYRYTITDQGCDPIEDVVFIHSPLPIQVVPEVIDVSCYGDRTGEIHLNITGGTGAYSIQWSNGRIGSSITGLAAGTYTVFIVDQNSCVASRTYTITQPESPIEVEADFETFFCNFDDEIFLDINVRGGTAPYTFAWSNGATTQNLVGIEPGLYTVTITDAAGCQVQRTYEIPPRILPFEVELTASQVLCSPGERVQVSANVTGGTGPYTYLWNTGATTPTISNLGPGIYTVTVTDANGCRARESIEVLPAPNWRLNLEALNPVSCFGGNDGSIQLSLSNAREPVSIRWSHGVVDQLFAGNLRAGTYSVEITDALGCIITSTFNVREPEILNMNEVVENSQCAGSNNGSISLNVTGGSAPYTFRWSHGPNSRNLRNLGPGTYSVVVTDRNGCSTAASYTILEPDPLEMTSDFSEELACHGDRHGYINVGITGGIQPYDIVWADNPTLKSLSRRDLPAGAYTLRITDDNGCSVERTFNIGEPERLRVDIQTSYIVDCENKELVGVAYAEITGGKGNYQIVWNTGETNVREILFNQDGEISVMVTDENGCMDEAFVMVEMPLAFSDADFIYSIIALGQEGEILVGDEVQFIDRTQGNVIAWEWNFGDGNTSNEQNPVHVYTKPGKYTITLMTFDALGCVSETSIEVEVIASYRIMVPNAFTPNGDGLNDTFIPKMRGIDEFEMHIFNKWGELVYSTFTRDDSGWDGTLNGVLSPNGNYVYKIVFKANDGTKGSQTGVFTLVH
ncbi:gliding motility-associated C-terminal domain-containing protein [Cecembia rubra]|uniref:Gliding motility-associated-like protein n=1 Tax=Cecembia rubra TaxID=1485585 RepID=A0A2P8EDN5_9BACT|nr:gliding motility-associated C-terminal domain-containing protein [Cecembia rubra]PSL07595.1 gliding motility-associated-like protein [Cecembia rubra]